VLCSTRRVTFATEDVTEAELTTSELPNAKLDEVPLGTLPPPPLLLEDWMMREPSLVITSTDGAEGQRGREEGEEEDDEGEEEDEVEELNLPLLMTVPTLGVSA
jgi:hypothetical protein